MPGEQGEAVGEYLRLVVEYLRLVVVNLKLRHTCHNNEMRGEECEPAPH
jgi:hypothetical protein